MLKKIKLNIQNYFEVFKVNASNFIKDIKNVYNNNYALIIDCIETYNFEIANQRLKTCLFFWPKNENLLYLYGILHILTGKKELAINSFKKIDKNFNKTEIFINILENNKEKEIITFFNKNNFSIFLLENFVDKNILHDIFIR